MNRANNSGSEMDIALSEQKEEFFYEDVMTGLKAETKYLQSKYFYDAQGDQLFRDIMRCEDYYLFDCELDIFKTKAADLTSAILPPDEEAFDLIELGPGDCAKSSYLLKYLVNIGANFNYIAIDISTNIIAHLSKTLPQDIPGLKVSGLNGDYLTMLSETNQLSENKKVLLFLGSNLGNMLPSEALAFCRQLRGHLQPGDLAVIGLDLKKDPRTILAAYNDTAGITRHFNLNLLERINKELNGNFDTEKFVHFATYDPASGACKSYLISTEDQVVSIGSSNVYETIKFKKGEPVFMEVSQKYNIGEINGMAQQAGFKPTARFYDSKHWFVDTIWEAV